MSKYTAVFIRRTTEEKHITIEADNLGEAEDIAQQMHEEAEVDFDESDSTEASEWIDYVTEGD